MSTQTWIANTTSKTEAATGTALSFRVAQSGSSKKLTLSSSLVEFLQNSNSLALVPAANATAITASGISVVGTNSTSSVLIAGTWNTTGTPSLILGNLIDTNSDPASLLIDMRVGTVAQFTVGKAGAVATKSLALAPPANTVAVDVTNYSLTGSSTQSMVNLAGTWNTTGAPTAIKANITDTASNAASLLMDLQVGGSSKFSVTKGGVVNLNGSPLVLPMTVAARQTGNFNAVANTIYPVDTTSGVITATLPASPTQGDRIGFYDAAGTWDTNNLTIGRNGNNIVGAALDLVANVEWVGITLAWDATRGWAIAP
jgi:hypothetical protein